MEEHIRPRLSHSNSFGNDAEKDTAGCRALNRKYIVIGGIFDTIRYIDLFSGIGGFREGFTRAGGYGLENSSFTPGKDLSVRAMRLFCSDTTVFM